MTQDPRQIAIRDYDYFLPDDRIARYPLTERDDARLLVYREGTMSENRYRHLGDELPPKSRLIFNDTKVVEARLLFQKPSGGHIEIFCLEPPPVYPDITTAMLQKGMVQWHCLIGGASKWKPGQVLEKNGANGLHLEARWEEKKSDVFCLRFQWSPASLTFADILHQLGDVPLPPYLKRKAESSDKNRYQTVYAQADGSVAAPTAGLHFTPALLTELEEKGFRKSFVTLHVGAGTFKPVKADTLGGHAMHAEWIDVSRATVRTLLEDAPHPRIAVGTTSLRTLESLYWLGVKAALGHAWNDPGLEQWDWLDYKESRIPPKEALEALLHRLDQQGLDRLLTRTQIIITPGYEIKMADALITNFHQPQSTLLLLIAALIGDDWKKVYASAMEKGFRFLSYGDGSLLFRK